MWLTAILLLVLVPVSWIGLLICWSEWMHFLETGKEVSDPIYRSPLGIFSFVYVGLQILLLVARAKEMIDAGDGGPLFATILQTILLITGVIVVGRWILY